MVDYILIEEELNLSYISVGDELKVSVSPLKVTNKSVVSQFSSFPEGGELEIPLSCGAVDRGESRR